MGKGKKKGGRARTDGTVAFDSKLKTGPLLDFPTTKSALRMKNIYTIVILPDMGDYYVEDQKVDREAIDEWLAENTVDFLAEVVLIWNFVTQDNKEWEEVCDKGRKDIKQGYPKGVTYKWKASRSDQPSVLPIDDYIEHLTFWLHSIVENEEIFPTDEDVPFPVDFPAHIKKMFKRMFRLFAIIMSNECLRKKALGKDSPQMMSCLKHFLYFGWKWKLFENSEMKVMKESVEIKHKFLKDEKLYMERKLKLHED